MTKALVTGARGFIGQATVDALLQKGYEVACFDRKRAGAPSPNASKGVNQFDGSIDNSDDIFAAVEGVDVIYHLAGNVSPRSYEEAHRVNVEGTLNLARAAMQQPTPPVLVFISSLSAAGPSETPSKEEDACHPVSLYGRSKFEAEEELRKLADKLPVTIIRPPCVFGPGDGNMAKLFKSVKSGWDFVVSRTNQYSWVFVDDLVAGMLEAGEKGQRLLGEDDPQRQGLYYLSDPQLVTFPEIADMIADTVKPRRLRHVCLPKALGWVVAAGAETRGKITGGKVFLNFDKMREAVAGSFICTPQRAKEELGFETPKPLAERIVETHEHYQSTGVL